MVASKPQSVGRSDADLFNKSAHKSYSYFDQSAVTNIYLSTNNFGKGTLL